MARKTSQEVPTIDINDAAETDGSPDSKVRIARAIPVTLTNTCSLDEMVARLRTLGASGRPGWVREFDAGLAEVMALDDPRAIPLLFGLFDDKCQYDEAMFSLIHAVEHFDREVFLSQLLAQSPMLVKQAPEWLSTLYSRVFNNDDARVRMMLLLEAASPEVRQVAAEFINELAGRRSRTDS
jgi:hypothetical protein